jgi:hypothetical protein
MSIDLFNPSRRLLCLMSSLGVASFAPIAVQNSIVSHYWYFHR